MEKRKHVETSVAEHSDQPTAEEQAARMTSQVRLCQEILENARDCAVAKGIQTIPHLIAISAEYSILRENAAREFGEELVRDLERRLRDIGEAGMLAPKPKGAPSSMYA